MKALELTNNMEVNDKGDTKRTIQVSVSHSPGKLEGADNTQQNNNNNTNNANNTNNTNIITNITNTRKKQTL